MVETIKDYAIVDNGRVRMLRWVSSGLSTEFAFEPPLHAEDRETDTECESLPVPAELLATRGTDKGGHTVSEMKRRNRMKEDDSRPVRCLLGYRHVPLLLGCLGDGTGLVNDGLSYLIVGRVAPGAEFLRDAALAESVFNDLVERATGVGDRLLIGRVAGASAFTGRAATDT